MGRISTILWDVDGTLLDFIYAQRWAMRKGFADRKLEITDEMLECYSYINDSYWKRLELGEITKAELLTGRFADFFEVYHLDNIDVDVFAKEYQDNLGRVFQYIDDSLEYCKSLRGKVKQYVVTNGVTATQESKLKISGLYEVMDGLFISETIGTPKPQKGFFDYCLAHIEERNLDKILIVGDSLSSDIKGGLTAGIKTCWYRPEGTKNLSGYQPDYEISRLQELSDII